MNVKKIIAAFAAAALGASLTLTPAAIESVQTAEQEITAYEESNPYTGSSYYGWGQISEDQYDTLTEAQKSEYFVSAEEYNSMSEQKRSHFAKITVNDYAYFLIDQVDKVYEKGTYYVLKNVYLYIAAVTESYVGHDILVNGEKLDVYESGDGANFGGSYYLSSNSNELNISMQERELTAYEKNNFVKLNISAGINVIKNNYIRIDNGDYVHKGDWYYICAYTKDYIGNEIYINDQKFDVEISGNGANYGAYYQVKDTDTELTITLKKKATDDNTGNSGSTGDDNAPGNDSNTGSGTPSPEKHPDNNRITSSGGGPAVSVSTPTNSSTAAQNASAIKKSGKKNITVTPSDEGITNDILSAFKSNKKAQSLTVKYSSTLKIEISKDDISGELTTLDFTKGSSFLSAKKISSFQQLKNSEKVIQLNFTNDGGFGGVDKVTVKSYVGSKLSGKTADIYEYKDGKLVRIGSSKINASGFVDFKTDHYGKFVIAIV